MLAAEQLRARLAHGRRIDLAHDEYDLLLPPTVFGAVRRRCFCP